MTTAHPSPKQNKIARWFAGAGLIAILFAPSLWMLAAIPPLWKDVDAYVQVTDAPGIATILHYEPVYCFAARIPLFVGNLFDCLRAGAPLPGFDFFANPVLGDTGVFLLLIGQHLSLLWGSLCIIRTASQSALVRILLAILWASNPLFYAFAHCVGSETLSLILLLFLAGAGWRILGEGLVRRKRTWMLFAILLLASSLTRHLNLVLAALLPSAFLLTANRRFLEPLPDRQSSRSQVSLDLQRASLAILLGIACLATAGLTLRALSDAAGIPYHSRYGFTFLWRLGFLGSLPPETRSQLFDHLKARSPADVRAVLEQLRKEFPFEGKNWDILAFAEKLRAARYPEPNAKTEADLGLLLNRTAFQFWWPPEPNLIAAARKDFAKSLASRPSDVVEHLFRSTTFYFEHPDWMPQAANLKTFRNRTARDVLADLRQHRYFRQWKNCRYRTLFFVSLGGLVTLAAIGGVKNIELISYALTLTLVGLLMMFLNCLVTEFQPRFTQPMWVLTIISATIVFGRLGDWLTARSRAFPG
ncbi:MAG: hypothetical protein ACR2HH_11155 [Chthoniobacterales bacterium]